MDDATPERFHLLLTSQGKPVQHGWWENEIVARRKFAAWVGDYSAMPAARIVLTDEATGVTLTSWPSES